MTWATSRREGPMRPTGRTIEIETTMTDTITKAGTTTGTAKSTGTEVTVIKSATQKRTGTTDRESGTTAAVITWTETNTDGIRILRNTRETLETGVRDLGIKLLHFP